MSRWPTFQSGWLETQGFLWLLLRFHYLLEWLSKCKKNSYYYWLILRDATQEQPDKRGIGWYGIERHVELPHSIQENHSPRTSLCSPTLKLSKLYCLGGFSMIGHCQWNFGWGLKSQPCNCVLTFLVVSLSPEAIKEPFIQESAHQAHQRHSWLSGGSKGFRRSAGSRDKDYFFIRQSLRTSKKPKKQKTVLATHFYFSPVKPILDFWPPDQFVMF